MCGFSTDQGTTRIPTTNNKDGKKFVLCSSCCKGWSAPRKVAQESQGGRGGGGSKFRARTHVEGKEVPGCSTKASVVPSVAVVILHVQGREGRASERRRRGWHSQEQVRTGEGAPNVAHAANSYVGYCTWNKFNEQGQSASSTCTRKSTPPYSTSRLHLPKRVVKPTPPQQQQRRQPQQSAALY